jgi:hypothetical protein
VIKLRRKAKTQFVIYIVSRVWGKVETGLMRGEVAGPFDTEDEAIKWHMEHFPLPGHEAPAEVWMDPQQYVHLVAKLAPWMEDELQSPEGWVTIDTEE